MSSRIVGALFLGLLVAACGTTPSVSGKVVADGAPLAGQHVILQGPAGLYGADTGKDGTYRFAAVAKGTYLLSATVPSTQEGRQQVVVKVTDAVQMPDIVFTGEATLTGTVVDASGAPLPNATVRVLGTTLSETPDGAGHFTFEDIPTGKHTVSATAEIGTSQTEVTLVLGKTQDVTIAITPGNGSAAVEGQVSFFARSDPSIIQVSIPAAEVSTQADGDGSYSLRVPPGTWEVYAQAPYYPRQSLGRVTVSANQTAEIPAHALSLFTPLPTFGLESAYWRLANPGRAPGARSASLLELIAMAAPPAYYAYDLATSSLRFVSSGVQPVLSADGKWAAVYLGGSGHLLEIENLGTSDAFSVALPFALAISSDLVTFSTDDTALFVAPSRGSAGSFTRVDLATQEVTTIDERTWMSLRDDRYLAQSADSALVWKLVTPDSVTTAFSQDPSVGVLGPIAYGVGVCGGGGIACPVDVLGPEDRQSRGLTSAKAVLLADAGTPPLSAAGIGDGHWLVLDVPGSELQTPNGPATYVALNTEDGGVTAFPNGSTGFQMSPDGEAIAFTTDGGTDLFVQSFPVPAPSDSSPTASSGIPLEWGWISNSRLVAFDNATDSPSVVLVDSGKATRDGDYGQGSGSFGIYSASWETDDGSVRFLAGSTPVVDAPSPSDPFPSHIFTQVLSEKGITSYGSTAVANWGDPRLFVFGSVDSSGFQEGLLPAPSEVDATKINHNLFYGDLFPAQDEVGRYILLNVMTGQRIALDEPNRTVILQPESSAADGNTLVLAVGLDPATGSPEGGGVALLPTPQTGL